MEQKTMMLKMKKSKVLSIETSSSIPFETCKFLCSIHQNCGDHKLFHIRSTKYK